ncbi:hypothetical protein M011DRAFT_174024 [Sporormia fimetaria CBS 119925]|uniref:Uncharacterized protein n=1 Tax=Sporormia fimetaria CBS 119925 TaxID=1340428 RepID=A0A6A6VIV5_9PLEO|nr:hypothetical protein M011DRAFT_174024 [Sporormia fimetaria CBS 119925]
MPYAPTLSHEQYSLATTRPSREPVVPLPHVQRPPVSTLTTGVLEVCNPSSTLSALLDLPVLWPHAYPWCIGSNNKCCLSKFGCNGSTSWCTNTAGYGSTWCSNLGGRFLR